MCICQICSIPRHCTDVVQRHRHKSRIKSVIPSILNNGELLNLYLQQELIKILKKAF